ncbi:hypothetical protein BC833DRAFT_132800 [Globomyces pollinis-pini]|nr:hypothetical protein BC833DRAFT_132800 [Globomyces pollinis-pini]
MVFQSTFGKFNKKWVVSLFGFALLLTFISLLISVDKMGYSNKMVVLEDDVQDSNQLPTSGQTTTHSVNSVPTKLPLIHSISHNSSHESIQTNTALDNKLNTTEEHVHSPNTTHSNVEPTKTPLNITDIIDVHKNTTTKQPLNSTITNVTAIQNIQPWLDTSNKHTEYFTLAIPTKDHHLITYVNDTATVNNELQISILGTNQLYGGMTSSFTDLLNKGDTIFHGACMFKGKSNATLFEISHNGTRLYYQYAMYELNSDKITFSFANTTYRLLYRLAIHMDNFVGIAVFDTKTSISMNNDFWLKLKYTLPQIAFEKQFQTDYFVFSDATLEIVKHLKAGTNETENPIILNYWNCFVFGLRLLKKLEIKVDDLFKPMIGDLDIRSQVLDTFSNMNVSQPETFSGPGFSKPANDHWGVLLMNSTHSQLWEKLYEWQLVSPLEIAIASDLDIRTVPLATPNWLYHWSVFVIQSYVVYPLY